MKVILYMAMTANGMIARENDETPWSGIEWKNYAKEVRKHKALILGRRTYEIMKKSGEFKRVGNPFTVVVTSQSIKSDGNCVFAISPEKAVSIMEERKIKNAVLGGGASLNASFMKSGLVGEIILDVEPMIFGKGIKLFAEENFESYLSLVGIRNLSKNTIQLRYKVRKV
ncbi:MAG: dihydrofolate reductase [Candidatus Aenigmarchaeota archaeon]|nr:dihydrofolate reductase [Candidatus Aenigmarchaeota archaeon]